MVMDNVQEDSVRRSGLSNSKRPMKVRDNGRSKGKEGQGRGGDYAKWGVSSQGLDLLLLGIVVFHVWMAPYTKVEESFNIQAIHDILYYRHQISKYDHLAFPGVVPRTFIGAIIVSLVSSPFVLVATLWDIPKTVSLVIVRLVLGGLVLGSFFMLRFQIRKHFGSRVSVAYTVLAIVQFHLPFYITRPLPNIFALAIVNLAFAAWISGRAETTLAFLTVAAVIFRCDVVLLAVPIGVSLLLGGEIKLKNAIKWCICILLLSIGFTVGIDSIFWQRWLWPEMEVFWFNSVLNRSSEWGVSPVHWYFTSALPRAMLGAYPLSFLGLVLERRVTKYALPTFAFVLLYSKLPHKELRFILFALPILNLSAAAALSRIYNNRRKKVWGFMLIGCILMLMASAILVGILSTASYANYPGGHGLNILHTTDNSNSNVQRLVHIDVLPAMTGISRFCERGPPWAYSKEEDLSIEHLRMRNFTYLLSSQSFIDDYDCLMSVEGFSKVELHLSRVPFSLLMKPLIYIHGSKKSMVVDTSIWPGCEV